MSLTVNAKTYGANSFGPTAIGYYGPAHTVSVLDDIRMSYVLPKPTVVFSGVGRTSTKLSRTLTLTGALTPTGILIAEINVSSPVGAAGADIDAALNDLGAFLASATYKTVVKTQQVSF
jgi:hypothetical protein